MGEGREVETGFGKVDKGFGRDEGWRGKGERFGQMSTRNNHLKLVESKGCCLMPHLIIMAALH